jgi:hypothetical protein
LTETPCSKRKASICGKSKERHEERNRHFFLNFLFNRLEERLMCHVSLGLTKLAHFYSSRRMEHISHISDEKLVAINRPVHDGELLALGGISENGCCLQ